MKLNFLLNSCSAVADRISQTSIRRSDDRLRLLDVVNNIKSSLAVYQTKSTDELGSLNLPLENCKALLDKIGELFESETSTIVRELPSLYTELNACAQSLLISISINNEHKVTSVDDKLVTLQSQSVLSKRKLDNISTSVSSNHKVLMDSTSMIAEDMRLAKLKLDNIASTLQKQVLQNIVESLYEMDPPLTSYHDHRSVLGRGTFGVTHRMKNTVDSGLYAVKVIRVKDAEDSNVQPVDMQREASFLQQLNHYHIVRYFTSFFTNENQQFNLVMELVTGGTIAKRIKDESVDLNLIVKWWTQLVSALCYMHFDMKIQHRDIKPENILLTADNSIKIIDLGLACIVQSRATKASKVGTVTYYSYEKAHELAYDGRDDVWAAGCVMAELMTKSRLMERGGQIFLHTQSEVNDRRLKLIAQCVDVDSRYGSIIGRMLENEQVNRCTSSDVVKWLTAVANGSFELPALESGPVNYEKKSLSELLQLANKGDIVAQFQVGQKYAGGIDVVKNNEEAFRYTKMAADRGYAEAQVYVGNCYLDADGTEKDKKHAFTYFSMAANQGNTAGLTNLGLCYEEGYGVPIDKKRAFEYYQLAAEQGSPTSLFYLGECFEEGIGTNINFEEAFRYYKLAADKGNVSALYNVGHCYAEGIGVPKNGINSFRYYNMAADLGSRMAINEIGNCFYYGVGVRVDYKEAVRYYTKAAELNNLDSLINLGYCYCQGIGVKKNATEGFNYYKRAADMGSAVGLCSLGQSYYSGIGVEVDKVKSQRYFQLAADQGDAQSIKQLKNLFKVVHET